MSVSIETVANRKRQYLPEDIRRDLSAADHCARLGPREVVLWNLSRAACSAICAGMLAVRWYDDMKGGAEYFSQGADITKQFLGFAKQGFPSAAWLTHHLIYCNLLSNRFDDANALAEWAQSITDPEPTRTDDEREAFGRLLGLFVLDRRDDFLALRRQCFNPPKRKLQPFWQWLMIYLDFYEAVLARDQMRFDKLMQEREKAYVARANNKRIVELQPEFGGGDESPFAFDFMGVGIAKVAIRRGLHCDFDATFLPKKVVDMA